MEAIMMRRQKYPGTAVAAIILAGGLALMFLPNPASAGELSAQQILDGLKTPKTRSLSAPSRPDLSADDIAFVKRVRGQTRSLSMDDREHMAEIAAKRPKVDIDITFDFNSAKLTPQAEPQLNSLGKALTSTELAGSVIMLGGHTDAKGGDAYNQTLSEHRAETVKRFLVERYRIPADNLVTSGYGKKGLKNAADPFDAVNRRVEIVNVAEKDQAAGTK
jgi:outer membrane protein OmpA-like peptidoglycan-associated protein